MTHKKKRTQFDIMNPLIDAMSEAGLSSTERMLLIGLLRFMNGDGVCFPSYTALEIKTGLSRRTLPRCINSLVSKGWLRYEKGSSALSAPNKYYLNLEKLGFIDKGNEKEKAVLSAVVDDFGFVSPSSCKYFPKHKFSCKAEYIAMRMKEEKKERESA